MPRPPELDFYFDIVCPFAYIASTRLDDIVKFTGSIVTYRPVLLGGLYQLSNADQGKNGSATTNMPTVKKVMHSNDFNREIKRYQVPFQFHPQHPISSVDAGRMICAFPIEYRPALTKVLYKAYWVDNENINSRATLLRLARSLKLTSIGAPTHSGPFSLTPALPFVLDESLFADVTHATTLRDNTDEAFAKGAFGVPFFAIRGRGTGSCYFGQDRMCLLGALFLRTPFSPTDHILTGETQ